MNISFENTIKKYTLKYKQPRRAQIYVGFKCHQQCGFCYYKHKCNEEMFSIDVIKQQIDFEYDYGIRDFEITGGEPSEYQHLRDVCQYIKDKDKTTHIAIITNGGLWHSNVWDLIDEVLISYHLDKITSNYDKNMFPLGSTYFKVLKTVNIAKQHNVFVRTNTVVGTFNYEFLQNIVNDLIEFQPNIINFLPVNIFDQATTMYQYIDYNKLRIVIKKAIDIIKNKLPNTNIYIRYMPFCQMEGYEQYILGHIQHIYDWFDWNRELDGIQILDICKNRNNLKTFGTYGSTSVKYALKSRSDLYCKSEKCIKCKYFIICDGVEKTNGNILEKFIQPTSGKLIYDPLFFCNSNINLYQQYYNVK